MTTLLVTNGDASHVANVTVGVGTQVKVRMLSQRPISEWRSPVVMDPKTLVAEPLQASDHILTGLTSNYRAVRRGSTTLVAIVGNSVVVFDVTVR